MTRQIKFRAWLPETKTFAYFTDPHINFEYGLFSLSCATEEYKGICEMPSDYEKAVFTQFTGLLDKNGKEIYEGDVVKPVQGWGDSKLEVVEFGGHRADSEQGGHCYGVFLEWEVKRYEIIGNIYENPELLK